MSEPSPPGMLQVCPECGVDRVYTRRGPAKFCAECSYPFQDGAAARSACHPTSSPVHSIEKAETPIDIPVEQVMSSSENVKEDSNHPQSDGDSRRVSTSSENASRHHESVGSSAMDDEPPQKLSKLRIECDSPELPSTFDGAEKFEVSQESLSEGIEMHGHSPDKQSLDQNFKDTMQISNATDMPIVQAHGQDITSQAPYEHLNHEQQPQEQTDHVDMELEKTHENIQHSNDIQLEQLSTSGEINLTENLKRHAFSYLEDCPKIQYASTFSKALRLPSRKRSNSLPMSWRLNKESVKAVEPEEEADGWYSDDEDWFTQDVIKEELPEKLGPAPNSSSNSDGAEEKSANQSAGVPMELEGHEGPQTNSTSAGEEEAPAQVVLRTFIDYENAIKTLISSESQTKVSKQEFNEVSKFADEMKKKLSSYYNNKDSKDVTRGSATANLKLSQNQVDALNGMVKFINKRAGRLNQIFTKAGLPKVEITSVSLTKPRTHRRMTFMAVLSKPFQDYFEQKGITQPVVEIRTNATQWTRTLVILAKNEQDVWIGECSTPLTEPESEIEYRYVVHDGMKITKDNWEWLHKHSKKKARSLKLGGSQPDCMVFDGIVLPSIHSDIWNCYVAANEGKKLYVTDDEEYSRGITGMLPNWVEELERGATVWKLMSWINHARQQQFSLCSGFCTNGDWKTSSAQRLIDKVMSQYTDSCIQQHAVLLERASDPWLLISSMIGLFHLSSLQYNSQISFIDKFQAQLVSTVNSTMVKAAELMGLPKQPINKKFICEMVDEDEDFRRSLLNSLLFAVDRLSSRINSEGKTWIALLPFIHMLLDLPESQEKDNVEGKNVKKGSSLAQATSKGLGGRKQDNSYPLSWWGLKCVEKTAKSCYKQYSVADWKTWLDWLQPWFKYDSGLSKSLIYLLNTTQLVALLNSDDNRVFSLPLNAIIAKVKLLNTKETRVYQGLLRFMKKVLPRMKTLDQHSVHSCASFLHLLTARNPDIIASEGMYEIIQVYILSTEAYLEHQKQEKNQKSASYSSSKSKQVGSLPDDHVGFLIKPLLELLDDISTKLNHGSWRKGRLGSVSSSGYASYTRGFHRKVEHEEVEIWEALFKGDPVETVLGPYWLAGLIERFTERLYEVAKTDPMNVVDLYCNYMFDIPSMDQVVAQVAFIRAEKLLNEKFQSFLLGRHKGKIGKLVDQALQKTWNSKDESDMAIIKNIIKWGNFLPVWTFYVRLPHDVKISSISSQSRERLARSQKVIEQLFRSLLSGTIKFGNFVFLYKNKPKLLDLCDITENLARSKPEIERMMEQRNEERQLFLEFHDRVSDLWQVCKPAVKDGGNIVDWLAREVDHLQFVETISSDKQVICDYIPAEIRNILDLYKKMKPRVVFYKLFTVRLKIASKESFSHVATVYFQSVSAFKEVCNQFATGCISIAEFEKHHDLFFNNNLQTLLEELPHMIPGDLFSEREQQVKLSAEMDNCHRGAEVMLAMKERFKLTGDFSDMHRVLETKDKKLEMRYITKKLLNSAQRVKDISKKQRQCLEAFADCTEFVEWVRKEVPKKDISNFVDLASSTLGEDDLAAQKTRYLLNALTGYTPLIYYNFEEGETSFEQFWELCKKVWSTMEKNPELEQNLRNSSAELDWIKQVKSHYGNVEIKSIAQATAIGENGIYRIGNIPSLSKDFKTLEDVIALKSHIEERGRITEKVYRYSDLKDLQSKLTLVAGDKQKQNKETIRRFDEMKDAVENIGKAYLEIRRAGCIQFNDMFIEVDCNNKTHVAIKIKFSSIGRVVRGKRSEKTALEHCQDIYHFMKGCIEKWQTNMDKMRSDHCELNFYTMEQLVVLRRELADFSVASKAASLTQSLPLLAMINPVSLSELKELISSYAASGEKMKDMDVDTEADIGGDLTTDQLDIVEELSGEHPDWPQEFIIQAVKQLDSTNPFEYEELVKELIAASEQPVNEKEPILKTSDDLLLSLTTALFDKQQPLIEQLTGIWDGFVKLTDETILNFLSVEHLAFILHRLRNMICSKKKDRTMPFYMERGRPHLIAASHRMKYQLVLSLYEFDRGCPHPTRNEVLLCTSSTRRDEVMLFLSRALKDSTSFYCVVNSHLLDHDICKEIEQTISAANEMSNVQYGLAFIYSEEVKNARIRTYLDKYLVKNVEVASLENLKTYVSKNLTVPSSVTPTASSADPDRSYARLIRSSRAGVGKSLQKLNLCHELRVVQEVTGKDITIPIYKVIDTDNIINCLTSKLGNGYSDTPCSVIHFDIAHEVESGVDELLFNLIILRSLVNSEGVVWQAQPTQYYIIECMPCINKDRSSVHEIFDILPTITCISPEEALKKYTDELPTDSFIGFDQPTLYSREWQTVLRFLECHQDPSPKNDYWIEDVEIADPVQALQLLIQNCGLKEPSWSELRHYVYFLSDQLFKVEKSPYCLESSAPDLPGFRRFVVQFMFRMAKDFATRSLKIAEETPGAALSEATEQEDAGAMLDQLGMKRTWESVNHPYLFFNEDGETVTPLGFFAKSINVARAYSLVDCDTLEELVPDAITRELKRALDQCHLSMSENFKNLRRMDQLTKLRDVMVKKCMLYDSSITYDKSATRNNIPYFALDDDPDPNYVLTMDNAKKILAIHQRLRVNIPVIIMGETGCGKTKLIEFMSKLQVPTPLKGQLTTMVTVKVHGGTTEEDIIRKVYAAQDLAMRNRQICQEYVDKLDSDQVPSVYTILFLDEANTTEAIGLVKEILCDGRMRGEPLDSECGLKIIAACNPYRRHTPEMIEKLKKAGLGYSVSEEKTKDKFGQIPMRHLVYRVQPLSQSLLPLVWDFGALRSDLQDYRNNPERSYIIKIVVNWNQDNKDGGLNFKHLTGRSVDILTATQAFMREQKDECSFVSLRDIHRILEVCSWFYAHRYEIFPAMDKLEDERIASRRANGDDVEEIKEIEYRQGEQRPLPQTTAQLMAVVRKSMYEARCLLLGLGVCYLARLEEATRIRYAEFISAQLAELIGGHLNLITGHKVFFEQVELCQDVFVNHVIDAEYHKNIAKNKALKENVFMMIVCIENRIPLFLVGKPGSSKSLSKAMVVDAMKGTSSKSDLFKRMKRVYMVSFQCSRHATPAGIVGVFEHCAKFQKGQDLKSFVSVVVLDEVGLAEDSENMPLKTLHPLLEDGCEGNTTPEEYMKCAFIGISNWALDPAKMNRGILVQRGTPDDDELAEIAAEICQTGARTAAVEESFMRQLARGYLSICSEQKPEARDLTEFFGLRDFYSLMKMVVNFAATRGGLTGNRLEHSIKRNFGGFDPALFDPMRIFHVHCPTIERLPPSPDGRPPTDSIGLIQSSLSGADTNFPGMESRYLLILTESLSVLSIILDEFASQDKQPEVVFGSRFRDDISYTQICQNIYRIKTCMDMGKPVILLNLDDLYESLYDALNQYFSTWGDKKFVDLGLGTHRVKAFVHDNFRLVVIADKTKVLSQFPIPLINRLEKHYVSATSLLTAEQKDVKDKLEDWCKEFVAPRRQYQMNTCPLLCDGCGNYLHQPFKLPCLQHFIGGCCREAMFREEMPMQCPVDHQDISPEFDWTVDRAALENRQYFENATPETVFIGYSSETMALAVRQATTDIARSEPMDVEESSNEFLEQVVKRAKQHLLQIATGESVLRLDRTRLFMETKWVEKVYMEEQQHENLFQYLKHHMSTLDSDQSSFIQVTSFAELMVEKDVKVLRENLKLSGFPIVVCSLFLKNFVKEDQFTETVRQFYEKMEDTASKLLIVQCETANENGELLDSVRYIIQRESEIARVPTRTVLLLTLPRGCTFSGYQGGKWSCVHIDDPRSPIINLPSISRCLELTPSKMIASLQQQLSRISQEEAMATDDDGMSTSDDLLTFLKQCLPVAVSVIKSDQMYDRVGLLKQLFNSATECQFLEIFLEHAHKLLSEQGQYISSHWVKADAAKASNMKQSETLRHALEDSLERAFVPALAAVISFVDVRENLKLLLSNSPFKGLWLQIFSNCDKLGLTFDQLTKHSAAGTSKLPKSYKILEVGDGHQQFRLQFPFSWLVKDTIDKLIGANEKAGNSLESMVETLVDHFESHSVIGKVIQSSIVHGKSTNMYDEMLKAYLNDFVFMAYPCANTTEHLLVVQTITNSVLTLGLRKISFVHIHAAFVHMRQVMNNLAVVFNLIISHGDQLIKMTYQEVIQQQKQQQTQSNVSCDIIALYRLVTHVKGVPVHTLVSDPYEFMCQVEQCRPVVQQVIESSRDSPGIAECRNIWTLLELKKLYVEHVVAPANVNKAPDKRKTYKLPSLIKNVTNANFQSIQAFEQVVHSLQETVMEGIRSLYENCPARCPVCIQSLDAPVRLPCQHILCELCAAQLHICSQNDCGKEIPPDSRYNPTSENMSQENLDEFTWLRDRVNKFFMYFVSELVFASEPEQAILEWLVDRVTFRAGTRQFGLFNSSEIVDASPVLRSYLLKLLLRCEQSKAVTLSLDTIIKSWNADKSRSHVQSLVLLMDCHKDLSEYQRRCEQLEVALIAGLELLRTNVAVPSVDTLKALADLQNALLQSVELITSPAEYELTAVKLLEEQLRRFLIQSRSAGHLQPGYMIARQLLNIAGKSYLKDLLNTPQNYLVPGDIKDSLESFTVPDALSLYGGDCYVKAKSAIDLVIISARDETAAREVIAAFKKECGEDSNLIMQVLFTRITRTFAQNVAVGPQVCELLYEELQPSKEPNARKLMKMLLDPHGLPKEMDVKQSRGINLGMLVLKLYSCLGGTSPKADLNPLAEIVNQPLQAATRYLPTMADNQYEIYQESIRLALQSPNENPVAYRCPNGHPYVIGNCGRPYTTAKCHDCGAQIGGQAHRAHAGNQTLGENDSAARSRKGHILGRQTSRGAAAPERDLSALSCAVMRCLTHLSMLTSSLFYAREVLDMIQPALVREEDVIPFLDAHIQLDLQHIARCCACSNDDCVLLLHAVIEKMSTGRRRGTVAELSNIEERKVWEKRFDANYIKPIFDQSTENVAKLKAQLQTAKQDGMKNALRTDGSTLHPNFLMSSGLWAYRRPLTLPAVQNLLHSAISSCPNLTNMADNYLSLTAVKHLPNILRLLRVLSNTFHSQYSRADAANTSLMEFIDSNSDIPDLETLVDSFIQAWNLMIECSMGTVVRFSGMTRNSALSEILFDQHASRKTGNAASAGSSPLHLVRFLVEAHNKLLSFVDDNSKSSVPLVSVNTGNVISLSGKQELLDLILTHSEYELQETTSCRYNWQAIEREVLQKYISNKPKISFTTDQLPCFVYQEDFNLHNQMQALQDSQERLEVDMQEHIINSLTPRISVLTIHLKELKVVINFLSVMTHIDGEESLDEYMNSTFGRESGYLSKDVKLKHVKHVWLLVKYTQADLLMKQFQEPFDDLSPDYRAPLNDHIRMQLNDCSRYNSSKTKILVRLLFEYISLRLNKTAVAEEQEEPTQCLSDGITQFIMRSGDDGYELIGELPALPSALKVKHASQAWAYIWTRFTTPVL